MVPCQPRQLVILSLPFAALVAFFWFKRRKSSSHSDPGGTSAQTKTVDKTAKSGALDKNIDPEFVVLKKRGLDEKILDSLYVKDIGDIYSSPSKVEKILVENTVNKICLSPESDRVFEKPFVSELHKDSNNSHPSVNENNIINDCNNLNIKDEPLIACKETENQPATPDFESGSIFHSTVIGDEKHHQSEKFSSFKGNECVGETIQSCKVEELESVSNVALFKEEHIDKIILVQSNSKPHVSSIHFDEQSTQENPSSIKEVTENKFEAAEKSCKTFLLEETVTELSDLNSSTSSTNTDIAGKVENTSIDTGIGSQDPSAVEDSSASMAQGQKTEENTQSNSTGLEKKLVSLGLDTQQPVQRAERDSANHSPAEVMLNSPAISTFSDAHSEGSSDSGKGCSDVATPPSCTPAGGSSVAGDQVPSVYEFVLPQVIVGRLIGRHGVFLHDIRAKTHTNVFIKRHPETNSLKICAIEGTQQDIDAALKMIRQKFPLRRFPDLTLERVTFVKNSNLPISPENLQLHLVEGVNNDVILSSLITAGHFFLQLPMHMSYQSLYRLACIMNSVYNTQESPPLPDPQPDIVCVAPAHGGWYRAQILSVDSDAHTSDIKFLDYGGFLTVDNSLLRQIRGDFLLLPFQAVECALANVMPAGGEEEWSEEAKQFVQLMTTQQTLQAQVYDYTETGLPLVYLYCTQFYQSLTEPNGLETKVVLLNQELVCRGFADLIDPLQEDEHMTVTESS